MRETGLVYLQLVVFELCKLDVEFGVCPDLFRNCEFHAFGYLVVYNGSFVFYESKIAVQKYPIFSFDSNILRQIVAIFVADIWHLLECVV